MGGLKTLPQVAGTWFNGANVGDERSGILIRRSSDPVLWKNFLLCDSLLAHRIFRL